MARRSGAIIIRELIQPGVIERTQGHPLRAGKIESAGAQVDLVTPAIHVNSVGPLAVTREAIPLELNLQVILGAEEVEVGPERALVPEGSGDGVVLVVAPAPAH